jgi:rSAM/selenodomain-associated transferase 1
METAYTVLDPSRSPAQRGVCALGVMIKAPRAGSVKTRLVPPLNHDEAAALSVCFLRDTAENIARLTFEEPAEGVAVYTPQGSESAFDGLLAEGFKLVAQRGDSFGERLFYAAEDLLALGYESLCLIDSDSPTLPRACLAEAVRALAEPGDRVVLGPSDDGGYYLIGLKRAHRRLFEQITWSTSLVLEESLERAREIGLAVALLPPWYDVDDSVTLDRLCDELFLPGREEGERKALRGYEAAHTRRFLSQLIEREGRERVWPAKGAPTGAAI